ncbi:MAG: hypothetical protein HY704_04305 [Gemmatimonadetes bacterium]|nr:hypothetical protein [Gemmatimonadota bacterium]
MGSRELSPLEAANLRANPSYRFVAFDRLTAGQRQLLGDLCNDPDASGILLPRKRSGLTIKAISRPVAELVRALRRPTAFASLLPLVPASGREQTLWTLVLDGILEAEREGAFVCGPAAYALFAAHDPEPQPRTRIARLSLAALRYGEALEVESVYKLSARLYFYNRQPVTPAWLARLPDPETVARHLGADARGRIATALRRNWLRADRDPRRTGWLEWAERQPRPTSEPPARAAPAYKLYVSPDPAFVRDAFEAAAAGLCGLAHAFKVGKDAFGILRPDKIVAYFSRFDELREAADRIARRLHGCPAHGVPFTAEIEGDGLLSWGVDPPPSAQVLGWREGESWRLWVTNRLATALWSARTARTEAVAPWRFALLRLRLDGVDTDAWSAPLTHWHPSRPHEDPPP